MSVVSQKRFIQEALYAHNELRQKHGVPPLELDDELSKTALDWSENLAKNNTLRYSYRSYSKSPSSEMASIGENILRCDLINTGSIYYSGANATKDWYNQERKYSYDGKFSPDIGNFSQVVWKNSRKVGFGFSMTENAQFYVVAAYWPAGNVRGQLKENVLSPYDIPSKQISPAPTSKLRMAPQGLSSVIKPIAKAVTAPIRSAFESTGFSDQQDKFIREALDCHNRCRRKHGVGPLTHNPELSKIAQSYAQQLAVKGKMKHSQSKYNGEEMGENLAWAFDSTLDFYSGEKATMQWYDEIKDHNFQKDSQPGTGHFTQVIWKATKEVGFGVARASDGSFYAVANYYPAGNFIGRFVVNVPRPY